MTPQELRDRTDRFSVDIINFCRSELPADMLKLRMLTQLQDAGTSVASNYHAACRAQSRAAARFLKSQPTVDAMSSRG